MRPRRRMSHTHLSVVRAGGRDVDYGISQRDSVSAACVAMFFPCEETGAISSITDLKGGLTLGTTGNPLLTLAEGTTPGTHVRMYGWGTPAPLMSAASPSPGPHDWLMVSAYHSASQGLVPPWDNGSGSFYLGSVATGMVRLQPYNCSFFVDEPNEFGQLATSTDVAMLRRTAGTDYVICAAKRGHHLEHYAQGALTGRSPDADMLLAAVPYVEAAQRESAALIACHAAWYDWTNLGAQLQCGHSAYNLLPRTYGTDGLAVPGGPVPAPPGVWVPSLPESNVLPGGYETTGHFGSWDGFDGVMLNQAQDYMFLAFFIFPGGLPDDIGPASVWMRDSAAAGNKRVWPGWVTL